MDGNAGAAPEQMAEERGAARRPREGGGAASFELLLFSSDPALIAEAEAGGVAGVVVDWEREGKAQRQAHADHDAIEAHATPQQGIARPQPLGTLGLYVMSIAPVQPAEPGLRTPQCCVVRIPAISVPQGMLQQHRFFKVHLARAQRRIEHHNIEKAAAAHLGVAHLRLDAGQRSVERAPGRLPMC